jgi:isoleucyl-tRNA synthetase
MHKSWGNSIELNEALEQMGADAMRWVYCEQNPSQDLRFGYSLAEDVKRRLLTFWHSVGFLITYANIAEWEPELGSRPEGSHALDRWLVARTQQLVAEAEAAYERYWTPALTTAFEAYVEDLSNWYIRRSRRRFWDGEPEAFETLWWSLVQALRVVGPVMPFLAEHVWDALVEEGAESVHLAGWPEVGEPDARLLDEMAAVRRVVELGRQARAQSGLKLRQPLRRLVVQGAEAAQAQAGEIADELSVKQVEFGPVDATELRVKPNLPVLGPKLGKELGPLRKKLEAGEFEELDGGRVRVDGHELSPEEVIVERRGKEGWAVAGEDGLTVALDLAIDPELELEGRAREAIHQVNTMRKEAGLEITDRIALTLPPELAAHEEWIARETLADRVEPGGQLRIEKS